MAKSKRKRSVKAKAPRYKLRHHPGNPAAAARHAKQEPSIFTKSEVVGDMIEELREHLRRLDSQMRELRQNSPTNDLLLEVQQLKQQLESEETYHHDMKDRMVSFLSREQREAAELMRVSRVEYFLNAMDVWRESNYSNPPPFARIVTGL